MKTASMTLLHWLPGILGILGILFISLFAADAFAPGLTLWQQLGAFFIHLIPSFVLLAILIIAWRWEIAGGIIFLTISMVMTPFIYQHNFNMNHSIWISLGVILIITFPFMLVGILFIASGKEKKRKHLVL